MKIAGSVFVVTGGISGLGGVVTEKLLELGAKVAALDINADDSKAFQQKHKNCLVLQCDVSDEASVQRALQAATDGLGPVRGVVNCAGIVSAGRVLSPTGKVDSNLMRSFRKTQDVNLIGTFAVLAYGAAQMAKLDLIDGERGVIINTASVAAFDGQIGQAAYSASKGGVAAMTLPLARDLARHSIRVNTIAPGIFRTPMTDHMSSKAMQSLIPQVAFPKRMGFPTEFASLVVELIQNSYMNGETVRLDGGIRMAAM
eukprot:gb/GEZN01005971.1/.p1 GENE.gb/GEZN01005971.1/~~gb/GEZN01005971.1/.p1  ORF type:complete len:257 (+),score=34.66 gb/GEZN01005971.1/:118-888(+)